MTNYLKNTIAAGAFVAAALLNTNNLAAEEGKTEDILYTDSNNTEIVETSDADTIETIVKETKEEINEDSGDNFNPEAYELPSSSYTSQDDEDMPEDVSEPQKLESDLDKEFSTEKIIPDTKVPAEKVPSLPEGHYNKKEKELLKKLIKKQVVDGSTPNLEKIVVTQLTNLFCVDRFSENAITVTQRGGTDCKAKKHENSRLNNGYTITNLSTWANLVGSDDASAKLSGVQVLTAQNPSKNFSVEDIQVLRGEDDLIRNITYVGKLFKVRGVKHDAADSIEWYKNIQLTSSDSHYVLSLFNGGFNKGVSQDEADRVVNFLDSYGLLEDAYRSLAKENQKLSKHRQIAASRLSTSLKKSAKDGKIIKTLGEELLTSTKANKRYLYGLGIEGGPNFSPDGNVGGTLGVGGSVFDTENHAGFEFGVSGNYAKRSNSSNVLDDNGNSTGLINNQTLKSYELLFTPSVLVGNATFQAAFGPSFGINSTKINNVGSSQIGTTVYNNTHKTTGFSTGGQAKFTYFPNGGSVGFGMGGGYSYSFNTPDGVNPNKFNAMLNVTVRNKSKK